MATRYQVLSKVSDVFILNPTHAKYDTRTTCWVHMHSKCKLRCIPLMLQRFWKLKCLMQIVAGGVYFVY